MHIRFFKLRIQQFEPSLMHIRRTTIRHKYQLYGTKVYVVKVEKILEYLSTKSVDNFMDNLVIRLIRELTYGFQQIDQFSVIFINYQYYQ